MTGVMLVTTAEKASARLFARLAMSALAFPRPATSDSVAACSRPSEPDMVSVDSRAKFPAYFSVFSKNISIATRALSAFDSEFHHSVVDSDAGCIAASTFDDAAARSTCAFSSEIAACLACVESAPYFATAALYFSCADATESCAFCTLYCAASTLLMSTSDAETRPFSRAYAWSVVAFMATPRLSIMVKLPLAAPAIDSSADSVEMPMTDATSAALCMAFVVSSKLSWTSSPEP